MKKSYLVICVISLLLLLVGCSSGNQMNNNDAEPQELEWMSAEGYALSGQCSGINPQGVVVLKDSVFISNTADNSIIEYDSMGNEIREVGQMGIGDGEFIHPSGLAYANDSIYVVDSGNNRIQVFDMNFEYQRENLLENLGGGASDTIYTDIAVCDNGTLTALTNSTLAESARLYITDENNSIQKTPLVLNGYACSERDSLYYVNTFELMENGSSYDAVIRESALYEYKDNALLVLFEFPYKYGPTDFVVDGEDVYVLSSVWAQLDHFKLDGTYLETIWEFDSLSPESYLTRTPQGGFVITDAQNNAAYFLNNEGYQHD